MIPIKDTHSQTVVAIPFWMWVFGGVFAAGGIALFVVFMLPGSNISADAFALLAGFLLVSIFFFFGFRTKVTFDTILGNITIRRYIWLWSYKTRHIPKKELQYATIVGDDVAPDSYGAAFIYIPTYDVSIKVVGRKKAIKIGTLSKSKANYLVDRIKAFQFE